MADKAELPIWMAMKPSRRSLGGPFHDPAGGGAHAAFGRGSGSQHHSVYGSMKEDRRWAQRNGLRGRYFSGSGE